MFDEGHANNSGMKKLTSYVGEYLLEVEGDLENNYLSMEEYYEREVQIVILDQDGEVMSKLYYDPVWNDMKRE